MYLYCIKLCVYLFYLQTILGEFSKEQDKFVTENTEKKKKSEVGVAPWVGYNEEEEMKKQILALSKVIHVSFLQADFMNER